MGMLVNFVTNAAVSETAAIYINSYLFPLLACVAISKLCHGDIKGGQSWILERGPSSQNCPNALNCRIVGRRRRIVGLEGDGRGGGGAAQGGW